MIAASIADLDGLGILLSQQYYWDYHHKLGHNLFFRLIASIILALCCTQRFKTFVVCLSLFHLHLLMDYWGSGPDWHIHYLWPMANLILKNPHSWEFYSWQNLSIFLGFLIWTIWIARRFGRTPIELLTPQLDHKISRWLGHRNASDLT
jgi:inner membrane protein